MDKKVELTLALAGSFFSTVNLQSMADCDNANAYFY